MDKLGEIRDNIRAYVLVNCNYNRSRLEDIVNEATRVLIVNGVLTEDHVDFLIKQYYPCISCEFPIEHEWRV